MEGDVISEVSVGAGNESAPSSESVPTSTEGGQNASGNETNTSGAGQVDPAPPAYVPNLKFKVHDKEKEFDAALKDLIKDKKTEDLIRDLYTKAEGIEEIKPKYQRVNESYKNLQTEHTNLNTSIDRLSKMVAMDDFDSFFDAIKIPQDQVLRWVHRKLQMMEMPPEQRAAYDNQMAAQRQAMQLQDQNQSMQSDLSRQQTEFREYQLQSVLVRPDISPTVQAFEAKNGPGSFKREVALRGVAHWNASGVDIPAEQAVREVMGLINAGGAQQVQAPTAQVGPQSVLPQAPAPTPVIPHIQGRGASSPAKKMMKSIADLKARAASME